MTQTNLTPAQLKALTYGALLGQAQVGFAKGGARARLIAGLARRGLVDEYLNITAAGYAAIRREAPEVKAPAAGPRKVELLKEMLARPAGASMDEITRALGWLPHTARARVHGLRREGAEIVTDRAGQPGNPNYRMIVWGSADIPDRGAPGGASGAPSLLAPVRI